MAKEYLGEFEELILTLVAALQEEAYGAAIAMKIETELKREITLSAVHITLYRLEDKGYVRSKPVVQQMKEEGDANGFFSITHGGLAMLKAMKESRLQLWNMVPQLKM